MQLLLPVRRSYMSYHFNTSNIVQVYFTFSPLRESGIFSVSVINDWNMLKESNCLPHNVSRNWVSYYYLIQ